MTTVQTARLGGRLTLLAALFGALGCSSPATTAAVSGTDTAGGFDIQLSDVTVTGADTAKGDAAEDGDGSSDATGSDSGADIQGDTATLCGSAGCPCAGNGDCDSGFCIEVGGQNECAALCVTGCEPGFQCTQTTSSTGDIASLCTPLFGRLCEPCQADADCSNVLGGKDNRCVAYSGAAGSLLGQFCAAPCGPSGDCPSGYACQDTKSVGGVLGKQCLRVNGSCECDARAQKLGLATPCSSGNAAGTCKGSRACSPSGLGACDAPLAQTETCNTQDDNCNGQTDEGGSSLCDDATPCTYDNCIAGECQHPPKTGACDDGSACTSGDYCSDGMCKGNALSCDDSNGCTADSCNPLSGCVNLPTTASCSDGDACTSGDACKDGQCVPGPATLCDDGNPCTAEACEPKRGWATSPNSDACDDNNACTTGDTCAAGKCSGGTGVVCNDGNPCTTDACDSKQGCIATPNTQGCEDGNACTTADTCAGGSCVGGPALPCDDNKPCTTDSCDPKAGCNFAPNTLPCDDGDACTQGDVCKGGSCSPGQAGPCSDGNPCTTDTCDPKGGCSSSNNTLPCDDGNACTQGDLCKSGSCTGGAALNCNDGNTCTLDSCDAAKGCQNLAAGGPCNDGNACTASDVCASGVCTAGSAIACNDGNSCTTDSCEPAKGCVFANTTAPCDDNNGCTTGDVCAAGVCKSGAGCGQNAVCAPKAGGGTACACASGYAGDGQTCTLVCPAGCTACSSPTVCTACEAGKNLVNGQCTGCVPKTCGSACGTVPNGCGKDLDCGPCTSNSIRAGNAFTCVVQVGGTVQCWGKNDLGQLGDGTYIDRWQASLTDGTPALVLGLKGVKQLALGDAHACALLGDGTIQCWGNHNYGQLGDGTAASPTGRSSPVKVSGITNAVAVTTGRWHTCALLADGTGKCWGHNVYGQLGDGTYTARNVPTPVQNLTEAAGIGAGYDFTCALFASGSVQCWGDNLFGQLGDGTTVSHNTPSPVSNLTGAASLTVSALGKFACVVEKGDTMQCWGLNANGQLGTNTSSPTKVPAPVVGLTNVKRVGAGNVHSCAALADGTVKCWGYNYYGQLGDGTTTSHPTPTAVPNLTRVIDVAGGQYHTCALHADGSVQCWGDNPSGALGNETVADSLVPVSAVNVPCGNVGTPVTCSGCVPTTCAAQKATSGTIADGCGGTLLCGVDAGKLATGTAFTCALPGDGSVRCWGQNDKGQLGDGTQRVRYQSTWVDGPPANVSGITKAIAVSAGNMHACAVLSTGKIRCWGSHSNGQLGFGGAADSAPHFDPVEVSGISTAIDVSAGHLHTCAVLADGTVKCWGYNYHGQLGDGTTSQRILPLQVGGIAGAIAVRAGYNFSCALTQAGQVKCWGDAYNGQLGSGTVS
ncbi:MAG: hypothetical protein HY902_00430, partial [Deltaproteobacteria bacterium]|nr:hypothetical protein [Deltaproteobacteria bacterium]